MTRYGHLEEEAVRDIEYILEESLSFGAHVAESTYQRFLAHFDRIAEGRMLGHRRPDVPVASPMAFVRVRPTQYLIAYNPETRRVLRILDGRRDLPRLLT